MINAKQEIGYLKFGKIKCAIINWSDTTSYLNQCDLPEDQKKIRNSVNISLKVGHTQEEFDVFMNALDFDYDDGYGVPELYGTIWLSNGDWMSRCEYNGSERWQRNTLPEIPEELK